MATLDMDLPDDDLCNPYICSHCCAPATTVRPLQRCGGCQLVAYCSKDCQKDDRKLHKPICKEFPVVNGINALHTTKPWEEHLATLRRRAAQLPNDSGTLRRLFQDPKVCHTCRESRPSLLTMCKCAFVCYCSKQCEKANDWHKEICNKLSVLAEEYHLEHMRASYPMSILYALEETFADCQFVGADCPFVGDHRRTEDLVNLKVHVVTNRAYFDAKAWEIIFHQDMLLNLKQLELVFITQNMPFDSSIAHKGKLNQLECEICTVPCRKSKDHTITFSVHQKPYHMFFSSSEYSEPDLVIVYGVTDISSDIHSEISYRNMTYSQNSVLVLTDSTYDLLAQGINTVGKVRKMDALVLPMKNQQRLFGSHKSKMEYDAAATNENYYLTCLRRKL